MSLRRTLVIGLRAQLNNPEYSYFKILNVVTSAKAPLQIRPQSQVPGLGSGYVLGVHCSDYGSPYHGFKWSRTGDGESHKKLLLEDHHPIPTFSSSMSLAQFNIT